MAPDVPILPAIPDATETDAALDFCAYVSDMIVKRPLTDEEQHALTVKAKFWFRTAKWQTTPHLLTAKVAELNTYG